MRKRLWIYKLLIGILLLTVWRGIFLVSASYDDLLNALTPSQSSYPSNIASLIRNYCQVVDKYWTFVHNSHWYSSKYSAFVYLLCRKFWWGWGYFVDEWFARKDFTELGIVQYDADSSFSLCDPTTFDNSCNVSKYLPQLFDMLINDYVNLKQASMYNALRPATSDDEIYTLINGYFFPYFLTNICWDPAHPYPKTCRTLKSYLHQSRSLLSEVKIFDVKKIQTLPVDANCSPSSQSNNIFVCGLQDTWASLSSFVHMVYNELVYYRLFMGYYLTVVQAQPHYGLSYERVSKSFFSHYVWTKNALSLSLRMMRDIYMAFPLHVWLLMYQEDIYRFGTDLARIAKPIYTLYDKLRNVQEAQ